MKHYFKLNIFFLLALAASVYGSDTSTCLPDAYLTKSIKDNLSHNLILKNFSLKVSVKNNIALISGTVESKTDLGMLVMLCMKYACIKDINLDNLSVNDASKASISDVIISAKIMGKLMRNNFMSSDTGNWTFGIDTNDGIVNLTGKIKSKSKKNEIISIINSTKGVVSINDNLIISS